jgi:glycosyltransferase involved in cell wall biosynthesis
VVFAGHQPDPVPYIAAMDVAALVSYAHEAFPQSLPQAMAMGKPVIGTAIPGIAEVVSDGETGLLVPARDGPALAGAILRLYTQPDLRARLARQGRAHCVAELSFDRTIERTLAVYRAALSPR